MELHPKCLQILWDNWSHIMNALRGKRSAHTYTHTTINGLISPYGTLPLPTYMR